jgi:formate dehydrogenase major subunit
MIRLTINDLDIESDGLETIGHAAACAGVSIPTLCFDARIAPVGGCRICRVEVDGEAHPQIACRTQVRDGMQIATHSPAIEEFRHTLLTWEAEKVLPSSYAVDPDKELHRLLRQYNVQPEGKRRQGERLDLSHPHIRVDMSQCIECLRCVHICEDVQGQFVWHVLDRGGDMHIVPDSGTTLGASSCVGCEMEVGYAEGRISGASGDRLTSA